jgi:hypothetical protein
MKFSWIHRIIDLITCRKHVFILKSSESDEIQEISEAVSSSVNADIDVYNDCNHLFNCLNRYKDYYNAGIVSKNDKKNTANIFKNIVSTINPNIRVVTYSDKKSLRDQLVMS